MSIKTFISQLDRLLKPLGFSRSKATWNRRAETVVDIIDAQVSKAGDAVTVNVGVLDKDVYTKLWEREPPERIEQPTCTVYARIGELLDGKDKWWLLDDHQAIADAASNIEAHVLPFLERMHARTAMAQWLIDTEVVRKRYPAPIITLAILKSLSGDDAQACELLKKLQTKSAGAWSTRAAEVAERLRCT